MYKAYLIRFFAGVLLALIIAPPTSAPAQQNVVVPIPSSGNEQPAPRQSEAPTPSMASPAVSVAIPEPAKPTPNPNAAGKANAPTAPAALSEVGVAIPGAETAAAKPAKEPNTGRKDPPLPAANPSAGEHAPAAKASASKPAKAESPVVQPKEAQAAPRATPAVPMPPVKEQRALTRNDEVPLPQSAPLGASASAPLPVPAPNSEAAVQKPDDSGLADSKVASDKPQLSEADAQVAAKLQETIADGKQLARRVARSVDRAAIVSYYGARDYAPLWSHDGRPTDRAKSVIARLKDAAADGFDPASYRLPEFPAANPAALAAADLTLTSSMLTFARHLADGRIVPSRIYEQVGYGDHTPLPADILKTIMDASNVAAALDGFNPPDHGFRALKRKLAELRGRGDKAHTHIPSGRGIKPGEKDDRVPLLRARLGLKGKSADLTYDRALVRAVQNLQLQHGINPSGIVGPATLGVLKPKPDQTVDRIIANMERWRWMPRDLGSTYVMVNIPDYTLKLVHNHRAVWHTKIVAGKPETPTPLASATMDNVIVNPSWHVPQSIIQNEMLPRYQDDPNIFERMGLEVKRGRDGNISVVQPPGAANALGRIKFNFPNKFQVYLHDTPEKRLFKHDRRAFSHGCMRVENPTKFGELILHLAMKKGAPNAKQIEAMFGSDERVFKLADRPQVHLTYQTAFVDDAGKLQLRDDVYGFDGRISDILHGREPRAAIVSQPAAPKREARAELSNEDLLRRIERHEGNLNPQFNPLRIFEEIFR